MFDRVQTDFTQEFAFCISHSLVCISTICIDGSEPPPLVSTNCDIRCDLIPVLFHSAEIKVPKQKKAEKYFIFQKKILLVVYMWNCRERSCVENETEYHREKKIEKNRRLWK